MWKQNEQQIEVLLRQLKESENIDVRSGAAEKLGHMKEHQERIVQALTQALKDVNWMVRVEAATALSRIGSKAKSSLPALKEAMNLPINRPKRPVFFEAIQALEAAPDFVPEVTPIVQPIEEEPIEEEESLEERIEPIEQEIQEETLEEPIEEESIEAFADEIVELEKKVDEIIEKETIEEEVEEAEEYDEYKEYEEEEEEEEEEIGEDIEEIVEDIAEDITDETTEDEIIHEAIEEITEEVMEDVIEDAAGEIIDEEIIEDIAEDITEEVLETEEEEEDKEEMYFRSEEIEKTEDIPEYFIKEETTEEIIDEFVVEPPSEIVEEEIEGEPSKGIEIKWEDEPEEPKTEETTDIEAPIVEPQISEEEEEEEKKNEESIELTPPTVLPEEDLAVKKMSRTILKVILAGDKEVGKTTLREGYCERGFTYEYQEIIGADFGSKHFETNNENFVMQVWDIAAKDRFNFNKQLFFRGMLGALLIFDISRRETFTNINNWFYDITHIEGKNLAFVLVGNKFDLRQNEELDCVSSEEGETLARKLSEELGAEIPYIETNASTNQGIDRVFKLLEDSVSSLYFDLKDK